jgi:cytochrome b6-f complex iron-sulfur subunit
MRSHRSMVVDILLVNRIMTEHSSNHGKIPARIKTRRDFLTYMLGTTVASVAMGYLFPKVSQSREIDLETQCFTLSKEFALSKLSSGIGGIDSRRQGN